MVVSKLIKMQPDGGARENRTLDLILARDALSQLSYNPLWWAALDSNQECHKTTDLQSAALPIPLTDPYTSFKTHRVFQFAYWTYRNSHGLNSNPLGSFLQTNAFILLMFCCRTSFFALHIYYNIIF